MFIRLCIVRGHLCQRETGFAMLALVPAELQSLVNWADWGLGPEMLSSSSGAFVPCFFTAWLLCSRLLSGFSLVRVDVVGQLQ
jgi:hypothetical protein